MALAAALPAWFLLSPPARVSAARRLEAAEVQVAPSPVHQRFRVLVRQVWSEPERGRFASRFSGTDGTLRLAVWQPREAVRYEYDTARSTAVVAVARREASGQWDALFRDGLTLEELERCLVTWLRTRPWRPVSVSSDFAVLAGNGATSLTVERVGRDTLQLRARKGMGATAVEFTLEIDRKTYLPQFQSIRYESSSRVLELRFSAEPAGPMTSAAFEPSLPLPPTLPSSRPSSCRPCCGQGPIQTPWKCRPTTRCT